MFAVNPVYVVAALRTPSGSKDGGLARIHPVSLAATVLKESINRAGLNSDQIENVKLGCATQTAQQGFNMARLAVIEAFGHEVSASTVNMLCGSGAEAINDIWGQIASGQIEIGIAGGSENNHLVFQGQDLMPFSQTLSGSLKNLWKGMRLGPKIVKFSLPQDYLLHPMGKSGDAIAKEWKIGREALDRYAAQSQWKAAIARHEGRFDNEIVPVKTPYGVVKFDETIRPDTTLEGLAKLPARFGKTIPKWGIPVWPFTKFGIKTGDHTAGNSSQISTGAAVLVLASERAIEKNRLTPIARLVSTGRAGTDPFNPGQQLIGPPIAIRRAIQKAQLRLNDIDLIELNEAFAAVAIAASIDLGLDMDKVNVNGGAIALGHPLGASGARLPVTLIHEMQRRSKLGEKCDLGLSSLCIGAGQAIATVFERV